MTEHEPDPGEISDALPGSTDADVPAVPTLPLPKLRAVWLARVGDRAKPVASAAEVVAGPSLLKLAAEAAADAQAQAEAYVAECLAGEPVADFVRRRLADDLGTTDSALIAAATSFMEVAVLEPSRYAEAMSAEAAMGVGQRTADAALPLLVWGENPEARVSDVAGIGAVVRIAAGPSQFLLLKPTVGYREGLLGAGSVEHRLDAFTLKVGASPVRRDDVSAALDALRVPRLLYPRVYWDRHGCRFRRVKEGSIVYATGRVGVVTRVSDEGCLVWTGNAEIGVPTAHVDAIVGEINRPREFEGRMHFVLYIERDARPQETALPRGDEPDSPGGLRAAFSACAALFRQG